MDAPRLTHEERRGLLVRLEDARRRTDDLFARLRPEAMRERPIPERHRFIFYLGHLEAFDWNQVATGALGLPALHAEFDQLFAFGIDPVDGELPDEAASFWPAEARIGDYNRRARAELDLVLARDDSYDVAHPLMASGQILEVILEHRLMHEETLCYMLHQLDPASKDGPSPDPAPDDAPDDDRMVEIPEGHAVLGRPHGSGFGWDNEFGETHEEVGRFAIDAYPVTCGQFLDFVHAGGYSDAALWSEADWRWLKRDGIEHPRFWTQRDGRWLHRTMFGEAPLPLSWPALVSHAEASAYARFRELALPTEAQWQRAAYGSPEDPDDPRPYPWGDQPPEPSRGHFDFAAFDPAPVSAHPAGASAFGVHDLLGNGWEWTSTVFGPLPGFEPFAFYPGYSANFYDGKHYVMKGGSWRTAACMLRRSFRNWFQPHYPNVYATFRCVAT